MAEKKSNVTVVIRSSGERTEKLCYDSVMLGAQKKNIHIVKVAPFPEAVKEIINLTTKLRVKYYLQVDADVVLVKGWQKVIAKCIEKYNKGEFKNIYEIDFNVTDRFIKPNMQMGVYLCNTEFNEAKAACLEATKGLVKPEGSIRHVIKEKFNADFAYCEEVIGYHGFMQFKVDIFNRWALRTCRNKEYPERFNLFKDKSPVDISENIVGKEERIAKAGWNYGMEHQDEYVNFMDFTKKKGAESLGYMEYLELKIKLSDFYKEIEDYVKKR